MGKKPIHVEPLGFRSRQAGCSRWLFLLVLFGVIFTFLFASAMYGF